MKTYLDRETGRPIQALLWDGRLTTALAEIDRDHSVEDGTGTLYVPASDRDGTWEIPVAVGEFFVISPTGMPLAMIPDGFYAMTRPADR